MPFQAGQTTAIQAGWARKALCRSIRKRSTHPHNKKDLTGQLIIRRGGETIAKGKKGRSPNDQRSDALNPNSSEYKAAHDNRSNSYNPGSSAHKAAQDNRANQMNPNHKKSKGKK